MKKNDLIKFFDEHARERNKWVRKNNYYNKDLLKLLDFLMKKDCSVLEVGCGTGWLIDSVKGNRKVGLDFSGKMIERAIKKYKKIDFIKEDIEKYKFKEKFDYIIIADTIGFFQDVQKVFENLRSACKPETRIIITYYNHLWEPILKICEKLNLKMKQPFENWLSLDDITNLLEMNNFQVVKKGQRMILPEYLPLISTILNKYMSQLPLIRKICLVNYVVARPLHMKKEKELSCSVIIPARNEEGNIERAIKEMPRFCKDLEIVFVEGGSKDNTYKEIKRVTKKYQGKWKIKYMKQNGKGKGDAVRKGFDAASGEILMILDADLTVPPKDLIKFYKAISENKGEFINGTRLVYPMDREAMRFLNKLGNKFFSILFTWILAQKFKDTLCGTKVLSKKNYEDIKKGRKYFGDFDPFGDFDLIFGAAKLNLKIIEIPIRYRERTYGDTNISRFKHGLLLLRMSFFAMRKIKFI